MDLALRLVKGSAHEIGLALGQWGRDRVQGWLIRQPIWREATDPRHAAKVSAMRATTLARFPAIFAEIEGLAEGLGLPFDEVFAWNCRGDIFNGHDGCTSVVGQDLWHNEDGLPGLEGACFLAELRPEDAPVMRAFCYPGSIPGHTFAITGAGLMQVVNNIRPQVGAPQIPRMVLGRAVLGSATLDGALDILRAAPVSGGFHFGLGCARSGRRFSVEFGPALSMREVSSPIAHANHALYLAHPQKVTASSRDRQERADTLLHEGYSPATILRDTDGPGLPIRRRDPNDPDEENTLATARLWAEGGRAHWQVWDGQGQAAHQGRL